MGDFVDRGFYSVETFLLLLALKVKPFSLPEFRAPWLNEQVMSLIMQFLKDLLLLCCSGALPGPNNFDSGKSRVPADHPGLWLL